MEEWVGQMKLAEAKKITHDQEYNQKERMRKTIQEERALSGQYRGFKEW